MSVNDHDDSAEPDEDNFEQLQRLLGEMFSGDTSDPENVTPQRFAAAAGLPIDPSAMNTFLNALHTAMQHPSSTIDWSIARKTAIDYVHSDTSATSFNVDTDASMQAFSVATLWLDESTEIGATSDAPRTLSRLEWVQQSIDTWIALAQPVAESITTSLVETIENQIPEELSSALQGASTVLRGIGGTLFAVQLGTIVGRLSHEVVSAGDVGIPLLSGEGREGGALLPGGVAMFAEGLDQDAWEVTVYLAVRELAHARLFRHSKWLRLHLLTAITAYARGVRIDSERIEEIAGEIDPMQPQQLQELVAGGQLIPPKTPEQEAAHERLETMLALIEGWVDVVTADAVHRLPGAEGIAEMVRRRRATGGPAEHAFAALAGLELRPRRLRDAAALWRLVSERSDITTRDGLWAHPDLLPTTEEMDHPDRLLERLGVTAPSQESPGDDFDAQLARLLDGDLPPHEQSSDEDQG